MAAQLAARGFTSRPDVIECEQGFAATQTDSFDPGVVLGPDLGRYNLPDNLFKYHASCYQTHAEIEAIRSLRATHGFAASDIERIVLRQDAGADTVCNIPRPSSGLETKFSLRLLAAYAVLGIDTADIDSYTDERTSDPVLVALRDKVEVTVAANWPITRSEVTIHLVGGGTLHAAYDSGVPDTDLARQTTRLREKLEALLGSRLEPGRTRRLADTILAIDQLPRLEPLIDLLGPVRH